MARLRRNPEIQPAAAEAYSVAPLDLTHPQDARFMRSAMLTARSKSKRAWNWYDSIPEIHYAVGRSARVAGYATLYACKRNPDGTPGERITGDNKAEREIVDGIYSPYGGRRGFLERFVTLMKVPGDGYLTACRTSDGNPDGYDWVSADEIDDPAIKPTGTRTVVWKANQPIKRIVLPSFEGGQNSQLTVDIAASDFLGRVWRPGGRHVFMPDSPLLSLDSTCEMLDLLHKNIRSKLLSRFALNGIFFVPTEVANVRGGEPKGSARGQFHDNAVLDRLIAACSWAVANHESPEAAVPIFMTGPGSAGEMIKHITYDRQIYEVDMKLRAELVEKILRALDNTPTAVTGSQDSNHWGAWASADEEARIDVKPDLEMACWALTRLVLRAEMARLRLPAKRIADAMVWYDLSDAQAKSNIAEDARQMRDRALVSDAATRRMSGVKESDAPTEIEAIRAIGLKMGDPYMATYGMKEQENFDWEKVGSGKTGPNPDSPAADPNVGPGVGNPGAPDSRKNNKPRRNQPA